MSEQLTFGFDTNDSLAGFRLERVEIFNWGTFNEKVWVLSPEGQNSLLTGDIGSGKSTIVDAITTLLVPAHRISYNKAAGAEKQERSLRSYVQGYYKLERNDTGTGAKPVALRNHNSYSVILGVFKNQGYMQTVTLAQVFWQKDMQGQPNRFFVVADGDLSIVNDFSQFGTDIKNLKKNLKQHQFIDDVYESFPPYCASFKSRFGIHNEQAMELFHQTVSMKSVGNLTDFVRIHMLEPFNAEQRIDDLIGHFDNLNRAHDAVLKAKRQVERLRPLISDLDKHAEYCQKNENLRTYRDTLKFYFAKIKHELLIKRVSNYQEDYRRLCSRIDQTKELYSLQQGERDRLRQAIAENGGDRLQRLKSDIDQLTKSKFGRLQKSEEYQSLAEQLSIRAATTLELFIDNQQIVREKLNNFELEEASLQNKRIEAEFEFKSIRDKHSVIKEDLASLQKRRSNIDSHQIQIRKDMCENLGISEEDIPFAGELLQIRSEESKWEGAIERLLRNFGLSLLVPEHLYAKVSDWVDKTNLRGRIVYFRVPSKQQIQNQMSLHNDSLVRKIAIKPESDFYSWLEQELEKRFDYACCTTMEQFRREKLAVTVTGQIKNAGNRHEKDDRHDIHDRSRYILGWSNEAKIALLKKQCQETEKEIQKIASEISHLQEQQKQAGNNKMLLAKIESFSKYEELDWQSVSLQIAELEQERKKLESTSDILKTLNDQLTKQELLIKETGDKLDKEKDEKSKNEAKQEQVQQQIDQCQQIINSGLDNVQAEKLFENLDAMRLEALGEHTITVESSENKQTEVREWLQRKIDNEDKRIKNIEERIIKNMQDYRRDYVAETNEIDAQLESGPEFKKMLQQLESDDLPKFEMRFKALLNENTIREIANFQSQLNRERQEIKDRIFRINQSLGQIEYNKGRYIVLEDQMNSDPEIRDFQQSLRACTEGSLTGSEEDQYAESKFLQVKSIIDRFRGREGSADVDKRWTQKVTDVRNWFSFAASERWLEDNSEYEHYTDSGGKSGGQKEKLAYTVLAASLAYQFGLEWGEIRSRSFRFVVIDEAFGRGSDESARFGLELFKRLNLQLLIVTPLQKIHIIEPYVSSVGFVYNPEGRESLLRNLTIQEYREEKEARRS
jgi:uncharacterized protein YPO0396